MAKAIGDGSYKFGMGSGTIGGIAQPTAGTAERNYTVQNEILDGSGNLAAIVIGGAESTASVTGYGSGVPGSLGGNLSFFGVSGSAAITKVSAESSNEDLTKYSVEIYSLG